MRVLSSVSAFAVLWFGLLATAAMEARVVRAVSNRYAMVGTQGWGKHVLPALANDTLRINVLELDAWRHSLQDGTLQPVARVPFSTRELIRSDDFSPQFYRRQIETLGLRYTRQRDILMYFGGLPTAASHHGLNFNAWSVDELQQLRANGGRPFIGLETMDRKSVEWMARRLHQAGYKSLDRIYVRIASEPSGMAYGSVDGSAHSPRHTPAAYAAYKRRFMDIAQWLRNLNIRYGLNMRTVFAGITAEDFAHYCPPAVYLNDVGYDLYVTPENKEKTLQVIREISRRFPDKPLVIPEFGVATAGPGASPQWAQETLGELLMLLCKHPAGVSEVTVFSVDVASRMPPKRWNWAWTPMMFEMLKEWKAHPRQWSKEGFHRYNPLSYPTGKDILYLNRPDLRIVYRKLSEPALPGATWFHEARLVLSEGQWRPRTRLVAITNP